MKYRIFSIILALFMSSSCVRYVVVHSEDPVKKREQFVIDYALKKEQIAQKFKDIGFDDRNEIKIALLLPLSGKSEKIGNEILNATVLALFDNRDPRIVFKVFDTEGSDIKTIEATKEIIAEDYQIVIGPVFSSNVSAMQPLMKDQDIFVFTFSNDISIASENTFLLGIDFRQQIQRLINYTSEEGYKYYVSLLPANDFGSYAINELRRSVEFNEGVVLKSEFYTPGVHLSSIVKRLVNVVKESPNDSLGRPLFMTEEELINFQENKLLEVSVDVNKEIIGQTDDELNNITFENLLNKMDDDEAVSFNDETQIIEAEEVFEPRSIDEFKVVFFVPDGGTVLDDTIKLLEKYRFPSERVKIVGISNWYQSEALNSRTLYDSWFVDIPHDNLKLYEQHYFNNFDNNASRISAYAYDAVSVITALLAYSEGSDDIRNLSITQDIGFNGINGVFKFRPDGISERLLSVYSVKNDSLEQISTEFSFLDNKDLVDEITLD